MSEAKSAVIFAERVTHRYGPGDLVLNEVDLLVQAGESLAVTGRSGCGKSTLLLCLAGIVRPDHGAIRVGGTDLMNVDDERLSALRRDSMGFVFQLGELIGELKLVDNVAFPLEIQGERRVKARKRALEVMDDLGIANLGDRYPGEVSGGQAQRAAVARALVHRPAVVFADEPTGALDEGNAGQVLAQLLGITREYEAALVMVTHDSGIASAADRQVNMSDGRMELVEA